MEANRDSAVSAVRLLALFMIVLCHIMQHFKLPGTWYLTAGVQVFLCISGFLYGTKRTDDGVRFFRRGAWKIVLDYWVLLLFVIPLYLAFKPGEHTVPSILNLFVFQYKGFQGLQHVWFLPTILACYLATPLLQRFAMRVNAFSTGRFLAETALLCAALQIVLDNILFGINAAWLFCFIAVYLISSRKTAGRIRSLKTTTIVFFIAAAILNAAKIYINGWLPRPEADSAIYYFHVLLEDYAHATFGIAVFFLAYAAFSAMRPARSKAISAVLRFSDRYGYDLYLVHYVWIEAPFGVVAMALTPCGDILVILFGTVISGMLLRLLSGWINRLIDAKNKPSPA